MGRIECDETQLDWNSVGVNEEKTEPYWVHSVEPTQTH